MKPFVTITSPLFKPLDTTALFCIFFEIEMFWKEGKLVRAIINSKNGGVCRLLTSEKIIATNGKSVKAEAKNVNGNSMIVTQFITKANEKIELIVK